MKRAITVYGEGQTWGALMYCLVGFPLGIIGFVFAVTAREPVPSRRTGSTASPRNHHVASKVARPRRRRVGDLTDDTTVAWLALARWRLHITCILLLDLVLLG